MVFIDGVKYACATCIKGHRSTACQHSDRPLFVIKRKGRPITQCSHCRELRKTQKVHVKCNCLERKKEETRLPQPQAIAILSQGIPNRDDITDNQSSYNGPTSEDKTSVGALLNPCQCLTGAKCICCRPIEPQYDANHNNLGMTESSDQTPKFMLPPIPSPLDNNNSQLPFVSWDNHLNNNNEGTHSSHNYPSFARRNNSHLNNPYSQNSLEKGYSDNNKDDDIYLGTHDQTGVLGEEICHSTSADLVNIIYKPFQSCSSAMKDGSCCGSSNSTTVMPICRCGSGCKCEGCDAHAERVGDSYNTISQVSQQGRPKYSCCSSFSPEIIQPIQPEHTVTLDEDGVQMCGCGCNKYDSDCSDCLKSLCEEYLLKQPPM
ncbi:13786_t:CDS:2 [Funneliformis caledonium]|uniref:13786_t:CDS:1 n=1 Tax=Funneliformis caledonium TaxID=1117310 RepID=A0A9N9A587_9GLOM|nr:13786_t:CDS:2 [Funneliformis caledonium]